MRIAKFLASRLATYVLVVWIGVTIVFFAPRLVPSDPVEAMIGRMTSQAVAMQPEQVAAIRKSLRISFGLQGSVFSQYLSFLKRVQENERADPGS